jgi:hypothetical protein
MSSARSKCFAIAERRRSEGSSKLDDMLAATITVLASFHALLSLLLTLPTQPGAEPTFCPRNRFNCEACSWICRTL